VFTTKVTHLRSLLFRQQDGINSVFKKTYLEITAKLDPLCVAKCYTIYAPNFNAPNFKNWYIFKVLGIKFLI